MFSIAAVLLLAAPPGYQPRCAAGAVRAAEGLAQADRATARRDARGADAALAGAIRALGTGYAPAGTIDDTGQKLVLADGQLRRGRVADAAGTRRRVLAERLELCRLPGPPRNQATPAR